MSNTTVEPDPSAAVKSLKEVFGTVSELPYSTGAVPLDSATSTLFYRSGDTAGLIDFSNATDAQLEALAHACQPASFGLDQRDVIDESYRKAGKLDVAHFATQLSLYTSGILENVITSLLKGQIGLQSVSAELYKLNVYGPGSFFKSHVDTPRGDTMFGSLVVVFPTVHEGGALVFHHSNQRWSFDSAKAISSQATPHAAFVAFYSDVEHEVLPVISGHRVTITYNLHKAATIPRLVPIEDHPALEQMKASLAALLAYPTFLTQGGFLGFALSHRYAFSPRSTKLSHLVNNLKGTDTAIKHICDQLELKVSLKALYRPPTDTGWGNVFCLMDHFVTFGAEHYEGDIVVEFLDYHGVILGYDAADQKPNIRRGRRKLPEPVAVAWIKPLTDVNEFETEYIAYGNEPSSSTIYGEVCLVAYVESSDVRLTA